MKYNVDTVMKSARPADGPPAPALERGFRILEELARSRRGVTLSDLARRLQLAKSTCHHLLATLLRLGYVSRPDASGRTRCDAACLR